MPEPVQHPASFRDPAGFVVRTPGGVCYRQVNRAGAEDYERLLRSGLYRELTSRQYLISHEEVGGDDEMGNLEETGRAGEAGKMGKVSEDSAGLQDWAASPEHYKTLLPQQLPFISYPSEWSPDQLRDVALLTLDVLELSLEHGMILKDASPVNVQFSGGTPVFIDTLSFTRYDETRPWVAYRQFCESLLFPLYLHHYAGTGIHRIFTAWPDGIPAEITARLLPWRSRLSAGVWMHVLLQKSIKGDGHAPGGNRNARGGNRHARGGEAGRGKEARGGEKTWSFSKGKLMQIVRNLRHIIRKLDLERGMTTDWSEYYGGSLLSKAYLDAKEKLFLEFAGEIDWTTVLDLGANDGHFPRLLAGRASRIVAVDSDWLCVNRLYLATRLERLPNIFPLCIDLCAPSPASGFRNEERSAFSGRVRSELAIALALTHHLVLGRNIPLTGIAQFFSELTSTWLIVEFVPLTDEKSQELVKNKETWHMPYDSEAFEEAFCTYFRIDRRTVIPGTERVLYRMKKTTL